MTSACNLSHLIKIFLLPNGKSALYTNPLPAIEILVQFSVLLFLHSKNF